jgi:thioesterase domain-containing protein/acyl carrier protein
MGSLETLGSRPGEAEADPPLLRRESLGLSTPFVAPATETAIRLATIWQQVLGVEAVGTADDFFDLGGDSFAATALASEIEATFGLRFTPSDIITHSTIAKQEAMIAASAKAATTELPRHLVLGREGGSQPPVFIVHGGHGFIFFRPEFIHEVGKDRPVYLFQAPGPDDHGSNLLTIEDMADLYVDAMRRVQPAGPYHIVAMCAGSFIALEMCHRIGQAGDSIGRLILLDPPSAPPAIKDQRAQKAKEGGIRSRAGNAVQRALELFGANRDDRATDEIAPLPKHHDKAQNVGLTVKTLIDVLEEVSPGEQHYEVEAQTRVAEHLRMALNRHVPRPYPGKAAILVNSSKARKIIGPATFWRKYLGGIHHEICGSSHQELFRDKLMETARFVSRNLERDARDDSEG